MNHALVNVTINKRNLCSSTQTRRQAAELPAIGIISRDTQHVTSDAHHMSHATHVSHATHLTAAVAAARLSPRDGSKSSGHTTDHTHMSFMAAVAKEELAVATLISLPTTVEMSNRRWL